MTRKFNYSLGTALRALALAGVIAAPAMLASPAAAQDVTAASVNGRVTDAQGQAVAGASVVLESAGTGFRRSATTSSAGTFNVTQLPPGNYSATISAPNFRTTRTDDIVAQLGGASYNFTLTAPEAADTGDIVVTALPQRTVDFSGTATGQVFDVQETARTLPVARNIQAIQLLAPQATSGDTAFGDGNTVSLGGSSVAENIYYINGMNVTNFRTFVGGTTIPFEFYDSVQVKTGGYQAEFGRNTGGAVIALSRSGTNELRGGFNVFYTPNSLYSDRPNTYNQNNKLDRNETVEGNIYASGPIIKDRLFFFAFFNPRDVRTSNTARTEGFNAAGTASTGFTDTNRTTTQSNTPFYGGKLDFNIADGHRLEATYFNDSNEELIKVTPAAGGDTSDVRNFSGGENYIFRYTGAFTDWLTISGLYGRSNFNQTAAGSQDGTPYVLDGRTGTLVYVAGNPNGLIEQGRDKRTNYRADVDLRFDLLGTHQVRFGGDYEKLNAVNQSIYSGGIYYRYYRTGAGGATVNQVRVAGNTDYVRVRTYNSGGSFDTENTAFYAQDSWDITPRLNLNLGVRYDKFKNFNASGDTFIDLDNQFAPRLGFSYDVFGDRSTRFTGFYGRYYLPVAANTNIRLAGNESFLEDFYLLNSSAVLTAPVLGTKIGGQNVLSEASNVDARTLVSQNLKSQYMDEFILGLERRLGNGIRAKVTGVYRKLDAVLEDADFRYTISAFCRTQTLAGCNARNAPTGSLSTTFPNAVLPSVAGATIGSGGYVLINPGRDVIVDVDLTNSGTLTTLTIPAAFTQLPKAEREYKAMEFLVERAFDGTWGLNGSYVLSSSVGNYEGGVKSDNGQDDTGLTQDFDEPGWMDGSYGYLPNHRRHVFKLQGSYKPFENFLFGFNGVLGSPRKFGCVGTYPYTDGRASVTGAASWYCSNPRATGLPLAAGSVATALDPGYTAPVLIGRGRGFNSQWLKQIDLSFQLRVPIEGLRGLTLRADVFNAFNFKTKIDYNELGDNDSAQASNRNYGLVTSYQTPRYVRLGASMDF